MYCRAAIEIDPDRHNAYKNLGIAVQNQGRYAEAAKNFIRAAKMAPSDTRALVHLEGLIAGHREIFEETPERMDQLHDCHEAAKGMEGESRLQ
jgi:tetratricopeptide (TPR) repeat protein